MMKLEIYPTIWDRDPDDDDTLGYCIEYFDELKKAISSAVNNGLGMVLYLC